MTYSDLFDQTQRDFISRHIGPDKRECADMLAQIGMTSLDALIGQTVPDSIRSTAPLALDAPLSEAALLSHMHDLAGKNKVMTSLIGMGYYDCYTPPVLQRNILENPGWYTAYTPYQPEIAQGRLEALLNFQTMICEMTGLDMANASLLDEATAAAEAMAVAHRVSKSKAVSFFVDEDCHPQTVAVLKTRAEPLGWQVIIGDPVADMNPDEVFGALFHYPGSSGVVRDYRSAIEGLKAAGGFAVMACDLLALCLLTPPGELGADMAIGSAQRFGVPMGYGGPHAAFMATADKHKRALPGRIIGVSVDASGAPAYRLALQTREQHIRREKATSNICTAQALLAIMASMYAVWHGPDGLTLIARRIHHLTSILATGLRAAGLSVTAPGFDTITVRCDDVSGFMDRAVAAGMNVRRGEGHIGISLDETCERKTVETLWSLFGVAAEFDSLDGTTASALPEALTRTTAFLTHPVFHTYRSETEMMRYLRKLSDKDLALDRTMIPLGSCTMKLNAAAEMMPVSMPEFARMHPFCPADQAQGYHQMITELEAQLCEITGYDAISMQPNSGAQGEYAGLLAIRGYLQARGETHRTIFLIPSSAHGTNPASSQMAGFQVVVVASDEEGSVDIADLKDKIAEHADNLAAIMVTYPSTHGVFEEDITTICNLVHDAGGQVYLDGANLNAQVGVSQPGAFGADVSHLNLHKTFCIPHGGGGPGMGPIGVRAHLAPYLAGHVMHDNPQSATGQISAAPFGSPLILPISYAYIKMMGSSGLTHATKIAILSANYIAESLSGDYQILYRGARGHVAHEAILDTRPLKQSVGIDAEDIAKRLMDYGFHAPTMSFPVAGTLMIEPTESESKSEIDRFISAMKAVRAEIAKIEAGDWPVDDNPLVNAPHTSEMLTAEDWSHPYSRHEACFPSGTDISTKYWPPVRRIDNAFGDRNLICTCPPLSEYEDAAE